MAAAITMQILCWISIVFISHGSSLNVNRPTNRWARSDDASDGWQASNGPYNPGPYPISRPAVTEVIPTASTTSTASTVSTVPKADEGLHFLTAASPEGFYEVMVGNKSPISGMMGAGGNYASTGSPDVIIGRVMSATAGIESATTTSGIGYSHPPGLVSSTTTVIEEEKKKTEAEKETEERSEIRDALEMESRSTSGDSFFKKNDYSLPPGSFYLPAVSRKDHKYYSDSEKAIYIPLRRKEPQIQSFPVRTRIVLVNKNQPVTPVVFSPPPAFYNKNDEEEEEEEVEEEQEDRTADEDDQDNEDDQNISGPLQKDKDDQPTTPVQSHSSALDLVMTLYPNLPKLVPTPYFSTQHIKNFLKLHGRPPNVGGEVSSGSSTSVIHEAKVVTPPQGYLPQLLPKPTIKPSVINENALLTQSRLPSKGNSGSVSFYPSNWTHQLTAPTTGPAKTTIQFVPFTSEDISPLNFLLPSVASVTEKVTATDQPNTRSNYVAGSLPPPNGDLIADTNVHIAQKEPMKIVPAPKLDFTWNQYQPVPSETVPQSNDRGDFTSLNVLVNNDGKQNDVQQVQKGQDPQHETRTSPVQQEQSPGETAEVVVRSKMATSGNNPGNDAHWPENTDTADIITGYFSGSAISSTIKPIQDEREIQTTTPPPVPRTTIPPIPVEEIATTTVASRDDEITRPTIPSIPELHGNFQPSFGKFPYHNGPQDHPRQPELASNVPLVSQSPAIRVAKNDENSSTTFSAPLGLPNLADDQHVAGSQIHETSVYEENIPRVRPIKPQSAGSEGEGKSSTPFYKVGKMSPQGAMYTVTQGHSKVKFFGYNALHNGELKPIEGKYFTSLLKKHEQQQRDSDWKFSPYLPVRLSSGGTNPAFKIIPKKSIPISNGKKATIRPVFFAKRPSSSNISSGSSSNDGEEPSSDASWLPSIAVSEPFEYHAHLQKMAEDHGRLPTSQSPST
ncbi:uncharacterized protein LOC130692246 [Daphnia carinata]|uniref:uncharacterized protein LOC130692246 n=1 Tax=Daphnia carinata TaxID=120202 RepID=UPI00257994E8|nr:uncharacterized protein LOC130692246 [Daphnia carinata]XP_057371317.1 uncharacterized protein LOC130692246 [Daphnia carinata]